MYHIYGYYSGGEKLREIAAPAKPGTLIPEEGFLENRY